MNRRIARCGGARNVDLILVATRTAAVRRVAQPAEKSLTGKPSNTNATTPATTTPACAPRWTNDFATIWLAIGCEVRHREMANPIHLAVEVIRAEVARLRRENR